MPGEESEYAEARKQVSGVIMEFICFYFLIMFLPLFPALIILVYAKNSASNRKKIQNRILLKIKEKANIENAYPVRYASHERFKSFFKIFPWLKTGVIYITSSNIIFSYEGDEGDLSIVMDRKYSQLNWTGRRFIKNGGFSWFEIECHAKKHYFTSETGTWIFGSKKGTMKIYFGLKNAFDNF